MRGLEVDEKVLHQLGPASPTSTMASSSSLPSLLSSRRGGGPHLCFPHLCFPQEGHCFPQELFPHPCFPQEGLPHLCYPHWLSIAFLKKGFLTFAFLTFKRGLLSFICLKRSHTFYPLQEGPPHLYSLKKKGHLTLTLFKKAVVLRGILAMMDLLHLWAISTRCPPSKRCCPQRRDDGASTSKRYATIVEHTNNGPT